MKLGKAWMAGILAAGLLLLAACNRAEAPVDTGMDNEGITTSGTVEALTTAETAAETAIQTTAAGTQAADITAEASPTTQKTTETTKSTAKSTTKTTAKLTAPPTVQEVKPTSPATIPTASPTNPGQVTIPAPPVDLNQGTITVPPILPTEATVTEPSEPSYSYSAKEISRLYTEAMSKLVTFSGTSWQTVSDGTNIHGFYNTICVANLDKPDCRVDIKGTTSRNEEEYLYSQYYDGASNTAYYHGGDQKTAFHPQSWEDMIAYLGMVTEVQIPEAAARTLSAQKTETGLNIFGEVVPMSLEQDFFAEIIWALVNVYGGDILSYDLVGMSLVDFNILLDDDGIRNYCMFCSVQLQAPDGARLNMDIWEITSYDMPEDTQPVQEPDDLDAYIFA